jgi:uncharacterized membrane protein
MESLAQLIGILLEHSQRLTDLWNFQIIVILGIVGFLLSHASLVTNRFKLFLATIFIVFALTSLVSLQTFQEREEQMWLIIKDRVADTKKYTDGERLYIATLKPTGVHWKAAAIIFADLIVILAILLTSTKKDD